MTELTWRKSSRSGQGQGGNCVEIGTPFDHSYVALRDTKGRQAGTLAASPAAFVAFVGAIKDGRFDG